MTNPFFITGVAQPSSEASVTNQVKSSSSNSTVQLYQQGVKPNVRVPVINSVIGDWNTITTRSMMRPKSILTKLKKLKTPKSEEPKTPEAMGVRNSTTTKADSEPNGSVSVSSFLNCEQIDTVQAQNGSPPQQSPSDTKYPELKTPNELS